MRIKIELKRLSRCSIDFSYSYYIASLIYRCIQRANPSLSLELHKPGIKLWTFSKLIIPNRNFKIFNDKIVIESDELYFYFSTPRTDIASAFIEGLIKKPEIRIGNADFLVSNIEVVKERKIGNKAKFVTLSPISVTTVRDGKTYDLYPNEPKFYENLRKNLIKKYIILYRKYPSDDQLKIKPLKVKPKRIRIKNTFHRCVEMVFKAEGSKDLLKIGYQAGFGERNSMGFGMVKVV